MLINMLAGNEEHTQMRTGTQIVADFVSTLRKTAGFSVSRCGISQNVWQVDGAVQCLLYVKGRGEAPYKWGVTKNVIERLNREQRKWFVVLLYESSNTGYFLLSADVFYYIKNLWPLAGDGDYKPATGTYLSRNMPFHSFEKFLSSLCAISS